jgi:hypothetical protein
VPTGSSPVAGRAGLMPDAPADGVDMVS